jgi:wobble nucleotide-excising tRNase
MLNRFQLIRNVGSFDSVQGTAATDLAELTLIHAENGRGKTTLCAILRSLASGDPNLIKERSRLGAQHAPHVVVNCDGAPQPAVFQNNAWSRVIPDLVVFDDIFVAENVHSGLIVTSGHRQNLHELILGAQGVALARTFEQLADRISQHNSQLRIKAGVIPSATHGALSVDEFCALTNRPDIDQAIQNAERSLTAIKNASAIRTKSAFARIALPPIDIASLETLLDRSLTDLDTAALTRLKAHFDKLGEGGEQWAAEGMEFMKVAIDSKNCPFCEQAIDHSEMVSHYRGYFSEEYGALKRDITNTLTAINETFGGDGLAAFQRVVQTAVECRRFWSSFCDIDELNLDLASIAQTWLNARNAIVAALNSKQAAPLEKIVLGEEAKAKVEAYQTLARQIAATDSALQSANVAIARVKTATAVASIIAAENELNRLKATKERFSANIEPLCTAYLQEKAAKEAAETQKTTARQALDAHRNTVFPAYQILINDYLRKFYAGFRIEGVTAINPAGRPSSTYCIVINNAQVPLDGSGAGVPCFRNTLSAGDRNSLALAFFFASLDQDAANLANRIVVIDDAFSSLDDHREITTVQEIRRIVQRTAQVIVLSHDKTFLCQIWEHADKQNTRALEVKRDGSGSTIASWDVSADCVTEYDQRHAGLREYCDANSGNPRTIAEDIRPILEGFLRVAYPQHFLPGSLLGQFIGLCRQRLSSGTQILSPADLQELSDLTDYANQFHHDTNPAWRTVIINDTQLLGFGQRTLAFVKRP